MIFSVYYMRLLRNNKIKDPLLQRVEMTSWWLLQANQSIRGVLEVLNLVWESHITLKYLHALVARVLL